MTFFFYTSLRHDDEIVFGIRLHPLLPVLYHSSPRSDLGHYSIYFAADNAARAYKNGVLVGSVPNWSVTGAVPLTVTVGDIIIIKAKDYHVLYGAIAALGNCVTKVKQGPWMAGSISSWSGISYPGPSTVNPPDPGSSTAFPYSSGAEYV